MSLEASTEHVGENTVIVVLRGALTLGTGLKTIDSQLQSLIANGICKIVLDLSGVPYMDSAGLGTLVHTSGLLQEKSGKLRLSGASERVAALLKMTRTDTFLPVDADVSSSLTALS